MFSLKKKKDEHLFESYSQCGEDRIVSFLFEMMGIKNPYYLDIGAHEPIKYSNTYLFYVRGNRGVCVEANADLYNVLKQVRPQDTHINKAIVTNNKDYIDFFIFDADTLSTSNEEEARKLEAESTHRIKEVRRVPAQTLSSILEKISEKIDFMSLDIEADMLAVLQEADLKKYMPKIICIETISYSQQGNGVKDVELINYIKSLGYVVFADTYINTVFIDPSSINMNIQNLI